MVRVTADFSKVTIQAESQWKNTFHVLKKITVHVEFYSQCNYLANMKVKYKRRFCHQRTFMRGISKAVFLKFFMVKNQVFYFVFF